MELILLAIIGTVTSLINITVLQFTALNIQLEGPNSWRLFVLDHSDCSGVVDRLDDTVKCGLLGESNLHGCPILIAYSIHQFIPLLHSLMQAIFNSIDQSQQFLLGLKTSFMRCPASPDGRTGEHLILATGGGTMAITLLI